jgi:UDP-glucose 4-epimerase
LGHTARAPGAGAARPPAFGAIAVCAQAWQQAGPYDDDPAQAAPPEMTSVLVTGGAGYIGSHAVLALLDAGLKPVVLDNLSKGVRAAVPEGTPLHVGDITDKALVTQILRSHGVDAVMHFAASIIVPESVAEPVLYYRNNTCGALSLVEACLEAGVGPFIFSSTAAVYGAPEQVPVSEDAPLAPISPYGASKAMVERMLQDVAFARPEFRPVCLRYFNVAGADPKGRSGLRTKNATHLIQVGVETALGLRPQMEIYGQDYPTRDGTCERDYIHVTDLASAHVAALKYLLAGGAPTVLNCGYGRGFTVQEVVRRLEEAIGHPLPVRVAGRRPGDPPAIVSDARRIRQVLDWTPAHEDLGGILASSLAWLKSLNA